MNYLSQIRKPIESDFADFVGLFNKSLTHTDGMLSQVLEHIKKKAGKRMRPMLILLMAKNHGAVSDVTQNAAVGLELLHTASLVHDDVVDDSNERRGQASVNAVYNNKVAVLAGDYLLSTALLHVSFTDNQKIVQYLAELGRTLASGEILQLSNINNQTISEEAYYEVIKQKTAALFEACCAIGALSAGASDSEIGAAKQFGQNLGIVFQIRDDIFDYYDSPEIGKPTGNDMAEGKLTLPAIHVLMTTQDAEMRELAAKVKAQTVTREEIERLVEFIKANGGIEYAEQKMNELHGLCMEYINKSVTDDDIKAALSAYVDYVIQRSK